MDHRRDHEWLETFDGPGADRYDRHARWMAGLTARTARRVAALLPPGGTLVDVGSGPGRLLADVAGLRPDAAVLGVDRSRRMVELATARLAGTRRSEVVEGDAARLPLADGAADVVTAVLTIHHWGDLAAGVAELARVVAPGGTVLVVEMHGPAGHVATALRAALGPAVVVRRNAWVAGLPLLVRLTARDDRRAG